MSEGIAERIGASIVASAIWDGAVCTWIGALPRDPRHGAAEPISYAPLGPDLYGGTCGVAAFLACLAARKGDRSVARTASGALRHAFDRLEAVPPEQRYGLYSGWPGIALGAVQAGEELGEPEWVERGIALMRRLEGEQPAQELDLIGGAAGALAACAILARREGDAGLLEQGLRLAELLLSRGRAERRGGMSWSYDGDAGIGLTGFAHGAAGVSWALAELYAASADPSHRQAAIEGFAYEETWFDQASGNWADLRDGRSSGPPSEHPQCLFWCHGAPGIALSRLRAWELLGDERVRGEALTALSTTRLALDRSLREAGATLSLCHGIAGRADVLLRAGALLELPADDLLATASRAIGAHCLGAIDSGEPEGDEADSPGLMLGMAGLGYFLLRLEDPSLPTPLLPT
jgi:lantibiotic modifying enzyme